MSNKILVFATYDSFVSSGLSVARELNEGLITLCIHRTKRIKSVKVKQNFLDDVEVVYMQIKEVLESTFLDGFNIILLFAGNGLTSTFLSIFSEKYKHKNKRPLVITGFPGIIFEDNQSILARMNSDILLCNNKLDLKKAEVIKKELEASTVLLLYGLASSKYVPDKFEKSKKRDNIYFIDQVKMPFELWERQYIVSVLRTYAINHPDKNVYIKVRVENGEKTVHEDHFPYKEIFLSYDFQPKNFLIISESMQDYYEKVSVCFSISSTVLFESMRAGIPAFAISDLGVRKDLANEAFIGSGIFVSLENFDDWDKLGSINPEWASNFIEINNNRAELLWNKIKLLNTDNRCLEYRSIESRGYLEHKEKENKNKKKLKLLIKSISRFFD